MGKIIILSTDNLNKVKEVSLLLPGYDIKCKSDLGLGDLKITEGSESLEENALLKVKGLYKALLDKGYEVDDYIIVADDTGLFVRGLDGEPGVLSARYAGPAASDSDNVKELLSKMVGLEGDDRLAYFETVIAFSNLGEVGLVHGRLDGSILKEGRGQGGFGYDPVFYVKEKEKTLAQMSPEEKNAISHRGRALELFKRKMEEGI